MIRLQPLLRFRLPAFEAFHRRSEFGGCYCAVWTSFGDDWEERCRDPQTPNLEATREDVRRGRRAGFLVEDARGQVVAWVGAGPKTEFPLLQKWPASRLSPAREDVWAIGCLALGESHRRQGLSREIISAVIERARQEGAVAVEAYPTREFDEPRSYRGIRSVYEQLGFQEVGRERHGAQEILRVELRLDSGEVTPLDPAGG